MNDPASGDGSHADISALSSDQRRELLRQLLQQRQSKPRTYPMSFAQQRLWFLDQLVPGNPFYNVDAAIRLRGKLDVAALCRSLQEIVRRHDVLRTTFGMADGQPVQIVHPGWELTIEQLDLSQCAAEERQQQTLQLMREEARRPFDLQSGPLVRSTLITLADGDYMLLVTMHHIVSDGWSTGVLLGELAALYDAFRAGLPSPLPPLAVQYADYAVWQRKLLTDEVLESQLQYWQRQLTHLPPLQLPADMPRPATPSFRGGRIWIEIPADISNGLRKLCRQEDVTLFMLLLAAFQVLLHRYTGQQDVVVGTPVAGRNRAEFEPLIGFFVNTLVIRTDFSGRPTFRELLERVRKVALDALVHQDLPFERLVEQLQPDRDLSRNPLCQVVFALHNAPTSVLALDGIDVSFPSVSNETTRFDLVLDAWESPNQEAISGRLEYSRDLFAEDTIAALGRHYVTLLEAIVAEPDTPVDNLALLSEAEQNQLLQIWNDTAADYPTDRCVHQEFEVRAAEAPEKLAVACDEQALTYGELNQQANQFAHKLIARGVTPGAMVAVCLEPSLSWVVALLGTLKAGAAFVALDASYPAARIKMMLADSQAVAVVIDRSQAQRLEIAEQSCMLIDELRLGAGEAALANPALPLDASSLAYVIYTSGSTGEPNGVAIAHRSLMNLATWHQRTYHITPRDRASQVAAPAFDASVWELWPYLAAGASVHIAGDAVRRDPVRVIEWLAQQDITLAFLPTPLAEAALARELPADLRLRALLTGGDRLRRGLDRPLPFALVNHYGPTEYTVVTTAGLVEPQPAESASHPPPIGRPIANTRVYVLDPRGQLVPPRVPGELFVSGAGLARGYLNRPHLNARRFVPNPFAADPAARMYRTGDRVRYRFDGQLEFLDRTDAQISVSGFRIEPGEIEAVLAQHPAVQEAVVVGRRDGGATRLVAYVIRSARYRAGDSSLENDLIGRWQQLYDETYDSSKSRQASFDITGWLSSYSGLPIPDREMREWVEATTARIAERRPQRVLEIGCGTGLLLHRLAPQCKTYVGTDFSPVVIAKLAAAVAQQQLSRVKLVNCRADSLSGIETSAFDAVILNSIIQYFPSPDYLNKVITRAVECAAPGGFVFIGDVRSLPLLRLFHTSVQLHRAPASLTLAQLQQRVESAVQQEEELAVAPAFFLDLAKRLDRVRAVRVEPKRGRYANELNRFRYDVLLEIENPKAAGCGRPRILDWDKDRLTAAEIEPLLSAHQPDSLVVRGVVNLRVADDVRAAELLASSPADMTVGALREMLRHTRPPSTNPGHAADPETFWALAGSQTYQVELCWENHGSDGRFDVCLRRVGPIANTATPSHKEVSLSSDQRHLRQTTAFHGREHDSSPTDLVAHTNHPLLAVISQQLTPELRRFVRERLPEHMVPAAFMYVDSLPLTFNGKVDAAALPVPSLGRAGAGASFISPRCPLEEVLASIWADLLRVERVGVQDNFFEVGGHSLLGIQLLSRVRDLFGVDLPVRRLFDAPTVEGLAACLTSDSAMRPRVEEIASLTLKLSKMSDSEVAAQLDPQAR